GACVVDEVCVVGGGAVDGEPGVRDVVQGGPAGAPHGGGAGRVVDPQHRAAQPRAACRALDAAREPVVDARVDLAGQPLGRLVEQQPPGGDPVDVGGRAQAPPGSGDTAAAEPVQRVRGGLDEQHACPGVRAAQLRDEVL